MLRESVYQRDKQITLSERSDAQLVISRSGRYVKFRPACAYSLYQIDNGLRACDVPGCLLYCARVISSVVKAHCSIDKFRKNWINLQIPTIQRQRLEKCLNQVTIIRQQSTGSSLYRTVDFAVPMTLTAVCTLGRMPGACKVPALQTVTANCDKQDAEEIASIPAVLHGIRQMQC